MQLRSKCVSLNHEPCLIRPTLIDLNPVELKYHSFMISVDKCSGICNVLLPKNMFSERNKRQMLKHLIWQQIKKKLKQ